VPAAKSPNPAPLQAASLAVIGLGYVGLPLALALAKHFPVLGFDIDRGRVDELRTGIDRTKEADAEALRSSSLRLSADPADLPGHAVYIVTVPTPVDAQNQPDLGPVRSASRTVGQALARNPVPGAIVVYESTVYPGVTEEICGPILEAESGLTCGKDFFLGYSPERINPGDKVHTVDKITKVVAGQTPDVAAKLADIYGQITTGGIHLAPNIKTAEAAKVIENAQRDINIAFVNEITMIFGKMGISTYDVLEAAGTKWNFLKFQPGLVGGHCIGVDPYYLAHRAEELGHHARIILSGRAINDGMSRYIGDCVSARIAPGSQILVLGLTFKEDVPDLRNSKVADLIVHLRQLGHRVIVHDPLANPDEAQHEYGIMLTPKLDQIGGCDAIVAAVPHQAYREMTPTGLARLLKPGGLVADLKGIWRNQAIPESLKYWTL
jgi:UDP-N-acetyl-D-galactosamine dehydrogenase